MSMQDPNDFMLISYISDAIDLSSWAITLHELSNINRVYFSGNGRHYGTVSRPLGTNNLNIVGYINVKHYSEYDRSIDNMVIVEGEGLSDEEVNKYLRKVEIDLQFSNDLSKILYDT